MLPEVIAHSGIPETISIRSSMALIGFYRLRRGRVGIESARCLATQKLPMQVRHPLSMLCFAMTHVTSSRFIQH
jgi:hypothetical protein